MLSHFLSTFQVSRCVRTSCSLYLLGYSQHPSVLCHAKSRAEAAKVDDKQDQQ